MIPMSILPYIGQAMTAAANGTNSQRTDNALIPSLVQGGIGAAQLIGSIPKLLTGRPDYEISQGMRNALAIAKARSLDNIPGYSERRDDINLALSNQIQAATQGGNAQVGFAGAMGGATKAIRELGVDNAAYRDKMMSNLQQTEMAYGKMEDAEFQLNELAPYLDARREGRHMAGAGATNIMDALRDYYKINR